MVGLVGFEPTPPALSRRCSNQLSYRPLACLLTADKRERSTSLLRVLKLEKGGDPAAPSDTATLLRLHPSHESLLKDLPPLRVSAAISGAINSHGVTGGV